jgi:16S rRNA (cytidine1402-2'-O)-methyltransferase
MHNEHKKLESVINKLRRDFEIALISDAGTPGISDPGFLLVRECINNEVEVECLPGPTAFVPALVSSGLPSDRFSFEGFLPVKKGRTKRLKELSIETKTMVFYESPHRILKTLNDLSNYFDVESQISVSRELTKLYEETFRGTIKESVEHFEKNKTKGEFVIVLSPK